MTVLGGNMRLKAIEEVGLKEITIVKVEGLSEEQKKEFVIKDNLGYGEWDWDILANEWNVEQLSDWGLDVINIESNINLDDFFEKKPEDENTSAFKIVLEFTEEDYNEALDLFKQHSGTREAIVLSLLRG